MHAHKPSAIPLVAMFVLAAAPLVGAAAWGGWAVTTIHELPDYAVAGQPLTLAFTIRQHGRDPLAGLKPEVEARIGATTLRMLAEPGGAKGEYRSTLTLPSAGRWTLAVRTGFGNSQVTGLPLDVITRGAAPVALTAAARGERLFAAKGCVTCHVDIDVGPPVTGRGLPGDYVSRVLADPQKALAGRRGADLMPNLHLAQGEIAALSAFLSGSSRSASR